MAKVPTFPRVRRGDTVFRVEWKRDQPSVVRYSVHSAATSAIVIQDSAGREEILLGKESLRNFGITSTDAVCREFQNLASRVAKNGVDPRIALIQCGKLSALLK